MTKTQIRRLRDRLDLTQAQFADRLGVSNTLICHWEKGTRTPNGPALIVLRQIALTAQNNQAAE